MFPTVSSLLEYLFGLKTSLIVPTFGFFVALAFVLSYLTFLSEFKRKEKEGVIKPFKKQIVEGAGASLTDYLEYGFLGFLIGFKVIGAFAKMQLFSQAPLKFILSLNGSWPAALLVAMLFIYLIYWQKKQDQLEKPLKKEILLHPYQLMPKLIIWAAVWGFLGAKVFNLLENLPKYQTYGLVGFIKYSGLTFLGGLTFGAISYLYIGYKNGMRLIDLADIGSPGMLVAYGVGRIGCQLSGDGDWGIVNTYPKPFDWLPNWMWSFTFPHNVLNEGVYINGCSGNYCSELAKGVFPTSFYEVVLILSCFLLLWFFRRKLKTPGLIFCIYLLIMGLERFFIEMIRVNYRYDLLGMRLSEAQIVSLIFVLLAIAIGTSTLFNQNKLKKNRLP